MAETRAVKFLEMIRRSERGRLKVYLGYGPGVGKTYQMLQEAHRLKREGIDVVVGFVETHGRAETAALVDGLEVLPRRRVEYRGITVDEFDVDACLARKPRVAIVDELAHTNIPGSRNAKRYQDVQELLAAGVHVITAMNIQHLESLYDTVENLVGVKVRERVPDGVLADADQVVNIDLAPEDLQDRLREGKIYPRERVAASLENFFREANLDQLRELAARELASQIDSRRRDRPTGTSAAAHAGGDQVMVCLSTKPGSSARLLRFGSRLAGRLNRNWYAVYVQTPGEDPLRIDAATQRLLADTLTLANQLGATVFTFKGTDVAETIARFAREYRVGQIVIGKPQRLRWWQRLLGRKSVAERLIFRAVNATVIVVDADAEEQSAASPPGAPPSARSPEAAGTDSAFATSGDAPSNGPGSGDVPPSMPSAGASRLEALTDPSRIVVCDNVATKEAVLRSLAETIARHNPAVSVPVALGQLAAREAQGSTFLNEGVALPHARIEGLTEPECALAITPAGVVDVLSEKPVEVVFLLLSPADATTQHLRVLAAAARLLQNRELRRMLLNAGDAPRAAAVIAAHLRLAPRAGSSVC